MRGRGRELEKIRFCAFQRTESWTNSKEQWPKKNNHPTMFYNNNLQSIARNILLTDSDHWTDSWLMVKIFCPLFSQKVLPVPTLRHFCNIRHFRRHPAHSTQLTKDQGKCLISDVEFDLCITYSLRASYSKSHAPKFPHKSTLKGECDECGGKYENHFFLLTCKSYLVWQPGELLLHLQ